MSISRVRGAFGLALLLAPALASAQAQPGAADSGSVPYAVLYQTLKAARDGAARPHLRMEPHISSHTPGVKPESIRLVVQSAQGPRPVSVAPDGAIAFPLEDALLAENPMVTTNQPKGSLTLGVTLELVLPRESRWPCADVLAALAEAEPVIAEMPARNPAAGVRGIEFFFGSRKDAQVVVRGQSERLLLADDDGRVVLMRDPDLSEPGAVLEFSAPPLRAQPYLAR
jgi:hypothetical protein